MIFLLRILGAVWLAGSTIHPALADRPDVNGWLDARYDENATMARQIWEWAEPGYLEIRSSALLRDELASAGFRIRDGVADIPTAFVAEYGRGGPVIAILAEFDALPGINQDAVPERSPIEGKAAGHACGHHLFGTASTAAAMAIARWLESSGTEGRIRVYGTPAEEGGSGKVYMVRAGLFDDVDASLHWHPSDRNSANTADSLANRSARFSFDGVSSHAAGSPENGRSALDGVEAMNFMVNLMREHVPAATRIHYVITAGGEAPNVVPDYAEVYYYVRHPDPATLETIWQRVVTAAEGAAAGTGTTMRHEVMHGNRNLLPNEALQRVMHESLSDLGGIDYDADEQRFAEALYTTLANPNRELGSQSEVQPFGHDDGRGSTDVGDVSWVVPTAGLRIATWVPGTSSHSWQAVAAGGMSIGFKGMQLAAKTLANTAIELFENPAIVADAGAELERRRGADYEYTALLGDREPPLDYRK